MTRSFIKLSEPSRTGLWALAAGFAFLLFYHFDLLFHPGEHLFVATGDGVKSYFSYLYHIAHDPGFMHFSGMNYPFGDLFSFTDGQMVLSDTLKLLGLGRGDERLAIALYNLSILLSIPIATWVLSLLFSEFGVRGLANVLFSIAVLSLSPQLSRWLGHLTMGYLWAIPAVLLLFWRLIKREKFVRYGIGLAALLLLLLFIHPYLGFIPSVFALITGFFYLLFRLKDNGPWVRAGIAIIASALPVAIFGVYNAVIDQAVGRTTRPWGFYDSHADFDTVFLPHSGPFHSLSNFLFELVGNPFPHQIWEGYAYIGIATMVTWLYIGYRSIRSRGPRPSSLWLSLGLSSLVLLLVSFCIPFKWGGVFTWVVDEISALRQFRALGRFAWPFYYVAICGALVYLYRLGGKSTVRRLLPYLAAVLLIIEGHAEHRKISERIVIGSNPFLEGSHNLDVGGDLSEYQSILTLPEFSFGAEYYIREGDEHLNNQSFFLSYSTGLPLMSGMMSRSPIPLVLQLNSIYEWNIEPKAISDLINSKQPILILCDTTLFNRREKQLIARSLPVGNFNNIQLFRIEPKALFASDLPYIMQDFDSARMLTTSDSRQWSSTQTALYNPFEIDPDTLTTGFGGGYGFKGKSSGFTMIDTLSDGRLMAGREYVLRFWIKGDLDAIPGTVIACETNPQTGKESWINLKGLHRYSATRGNWHLTEMPFTPEFGGLMKFFINRPWHAGQELVLDDLLIHAASQDVFLAKNGSVSWNNLPLPLSLDDLKR